MGGAVPRPELYRDEISIDEADLLVLTSEMVLPCRREGQEMVVMTVKHTMKASLSELWDSEDDSEVEVSFELDELEEEVDDSEEEAEVSEEDEEEELELDEECSVLSM